MYTIIIVPARKQITIVYRPDTIISHLHTKIYSQCKLSIKSIFRFKKYLFPNMKIINLLQEKVADKATGSLLFEKNHRLALPLRLTLPPSPYPSPRYPRTGCSSFWRRFCQRRRCVSLHASMTSGSSGKAAGKKILQT